MAETSIIFIILMVIIAIALALGLIVYPLWIILHNILGPKLDPILFKEPYFQKAELINYVDWPLSLVKSINYIYLVAAPNWAKKKRFKALKEDLPIGPVLRWTCKIHFSLMIFGTIMFFVFFGYLGIALYLS